MHRCWLCRVSACPPCAPVASDVSIPLCVMNRMHCGAAKPVQLLLMLSLGAIAVHWQPAVGAAAAGHRVGGRLLGPPEGQRGVLPVHLLHRAGRHLQVEDVPTTSAPDTYNFIIDHLFSRLDEPTPNETMVFSCTCSDELGPQILPASIVCQPHSIYVCTDDVLMSRISAGLMLTSRGANRRSSGASSSVCLCHQTTSSRGRCGGRRGFANATR